LIPKYKTVLKLLFTLLIVLTVTVQLNNSFFLHIHQQNDGTFTWHSHYFGQSQESAESTANTHQHSALEQLFYFISTVLDTFVIAAVIALLLYLLKQLACLLDAKFISSCEFLLQTNPRSPPHSL